MAAENKSGHKPGYELSPEEIHKLDLATAEEKMLYLRYVALREHQAVKQSRYQYLMGLLADRINLLQQTR